MTTTMIILISALVVGIATIVLAILRLRWVKKQDPGNDRLQEIGAAISDGAMAFMKREYKIMFFVVLSTAICLLVFKDGDEKYITISFLLGAIFSGLSGLIGMMAALNNFGVWSLVFQQLSGAFIKVLGLWVFYKWRAIGGFYCQ